MNAAQQCEVRWLPELRELGAWDAVPESLAEFDRVKRRWFRWIDGAVDHSFHLSHTDPLIEFFREREPELLSRLLVTPGDPTTEIRAACFKAKLSAFLSQDEPDFLCDRLINKAKAVITIARILS